MEIYEFLMCKSDQIRDLSERVSGTASIGIVSTKQSLTLIVVNVFSEGDHNQNYKEATDYMKRFEDYNHVIVGGDING